MEWEWLKTGIGPLKDLVTFLNKESKTNDILKRQVIRELRNNLNIFHNGFLNNVSQDTIIDMLSNEMIKEGIKGNFKFNKLKPGKIEPYHVEDDRNRKYTGWNAERLVDKIDEKIEELKNIKQMNKGSVSEVKNNISLMLSNLYYRIKLLADFIRSDAK
jgi:ATP-dependent helicase/DNAse subunit B